MNFVHLWTARHITRFFWVLGIILGLVHAWAARHTMNPDGISYLDMGSTYLGGNFYDALNAYWSPLYALLINVPLQLFRPIPYWEFAIIHLVNFGIYILTLACFTFLLKEIVRQRSHFAYGLTEQEILALGFTFFLITSLNLITLAVITPDMLVSACLYLAIGLIFRIKERPSMSLFAVFGIVLGIGYLSKAPLFPLAFVLLGMLYAATWRTSGISRKVLIACAIFLLISIPFVIALSFKVGRLTFGDSGRLNYFWYVNNVRDHIHWQRSSPEYGVPLHTTRKLFDAPALFEFVSPVGGMYSPWYDPVYWNEGARPHFDLQGIATNVWRNMREYLHITFFWYGIAFIGICALFIISQDRARFLRLIGRQWILLVFAFAGSSMYLFGVVRSRYTAPFILILWLAVSAGIYIGKDARERMLAGAVMIIIIVSSLSLVIGSSSNDITNAFSGEYPVVHPQWYVAEKLTALGLSSGETVGYIGYNFNGLAAFWAHLAGVRIVAEIPSGQDSFFWQGTQELQEKVITTFRSTGIRAIVAESLPKTSPPGWQRLGVDGYGVLFLSSSTKKD